MGKLALLIVLISVIALLGCTTNSSSIISVMELSKNAQNYLNKEVTTEGLIDIGEPMYIIYDGYFYMISWIHNHAARL
jgi:hypothetical protein